MLDAESATATPKRVRAKPAVKPLPLEGFIDTNSLLAVLPWRRSKQHLLVSQERYPPPEKVDGMNAWSVPYARQVLADLSLINTPRWWLAEDDGERPEVAPGGRRRGRN